VNSSKLVHFLNYDYQLVKISCFNLFGKYSGGMFDIGLKPTLITPKSVDIETSGN
jgi:hypothetical protein